MKNVCKVVSILIVIATIVCSVTPVGARLYAPDGMSDEEKLKHVEYWSQGSDPWADEPICGVSGGDPFCSSGCSNYAMAYALVKMGLLDPSKGDTVMTLVQKTRDAGLYDAPGGNFSWHYPWHRINELFPDVEPVNMYDTSCSGTPMEDAIPIIKGLLDEGYYVGIHVVGTTHVNHVIFVDGFTSDGKMSVGDSAWSEGLTLEDIYDAELGSWKNLHLNSIYRLKYKIPSNKQPSIYDNTALRQGMTTEEKVQYNESKIINEWDLEGMPKKSELTGKLTNVEMMRHQDEVYKDLTLEERINIKGVLESKEAQYPTPVQVAGVVMSVLGIICFVYALLITLGYFVDRFNTIIDVSVVGVLTLGHIRLLTREEKDLMEEEDVKKKGYSTSVKLFIIVGILCLVGGLMVSQVLPRLVYRLIHTVIS